jgi:hypothetical protein
VAGEEYLTHRSLRVRQKRGQSGLASFSRTVSEGDRRGSELTIDTRLTIGQGERYAPSPPDRV